MSNKPSKHRAYRPPPPKARKIPVFGLVVAAIVVLGVVAVFAASVSRTSGGGSGETRTVEAAGEALPVLDPEAPTDPAVGLPAPDLVGEDFDGNPVEVGAGTSDAGPDGRLTLVTFVAHWCPHCQAELPRLVQWATDGSIPDNVRLVAVATGTNRLQPNYPPSQWLENVGWPGVVLVDDSTGTAGEQYGLSGYPFFAAIGPDGNILARGSGELDLEGVNQMIAAVTGDGQPQGTGTPATDGDVTPAG